MNKREFLKTALLGVGAALIPTKILSRPGEDILNQDELHEMLLKGKPVFNKKIYLKDRLYLDEYDYPIVKGNIIYAPDGICIPIKPHFVCRNVIYGKEAIQKFGIEIIKHS